MTPMNVSKHATERYRERVDPGASALEARLAVEQIVACGRARPTPRRWMKDRAPAPGTRFVYWSKRPHISAIVADGTVVTVVTRNLVKASQRDHLKAADHRAGRPRLEPIRRWRWDGNLEEAA